MLLFALALLNPGFAHPGHTPELRLWSMSEGLPQSSVTDISQGPDGLLMLSTFGGLVRFDGVDFTVWDGTSKPISSIRVTAVESLRDGSTAFGTQEGALFVLKDGEVSRVPSAPLGVVWEIAESGDALWLAGSEGLFREQDGQVERMASGSFFRVEDWPGVGLAAAALSQVLLLHDGQQRVVVEGYRPDDLAVEGGDLLVASRQGVVRFTPAGASTNETDLAVMRLAVGDGQVWAARRGRVWSLGNAYDAPLPDFEVRSLLVDREGSVWVGLSGGGLAQIVHQPYELFSSEWPLRVLPARGDGYVMSMCNPDGGQVMLFGEGVDERLWQGVDCARVLQWVNGVLWVGVGDDVLSTKTGTSVAGPPGGSVLSISEDGAWVGTNEGLVGLRQGQWHRQIEVEGPVAALVNGVDGALWVGSGNGLHRLVEGTWTHWDEADGLAATPIRAVWPQAEGAWVGSYGSGLFHVGPGGVTSVTTADGLVENIVSAIISDDTGFLWLLGNRGVSRVSVSELEAFADGTMDRVRARLFRSGEGDGGTQPSGAFVDGHVSMATVDGLATFEAGSIPVNDVPPRIVLLSATLDGADVRDGGSGDDLRVSYTLGALTEPTLARFRYRFDKGPWVHVGARRSLVWEGLGAGSHHLEIVGANEDGIWSEVPLTLDIVVPYAWHERWWVRIALLLGFAGIGFVIQRWRTTALAHHNRMLQDEVRQRQLMEARIVERERHYRSVFEAVGDGLLLVDDSDHIIEANPAASRLFGDKGLVGRSIGERVGSSVADGVVQCVRLDGTAFEGAVAFLDAPGGRLVTVSDLTGLRKSAQAQRLEAIGRLAGGVAHDVNNLLMALSGMGALLREEAAHMDAPDTALQLLDDIDGCVERGGTITRELMAFGRRQLLTPVVVVAQDMVRGLQPLLRRAVRDDVRLVVDVSAEPVSLRVDAAQLDLAILNLVLNGMAAMPHGGTVSVKVYGAGAYAIFEVQDGGEGIPADVLPHIYEPFFTTRVDGQGLGLPSVHGFVAQSGGELHCETSSEGTLFRIRLPAAPPEAKAVVEEVVRVPASGRLLVCDDDPQVLKALCRMLRVGGYTTVAHVDAMLAADEDPHAFDGLVTDVLMPNLRGPDLAAGLRQQRPDLPVLYVSGYTHDIDLGAAPGPLLNKPFRLPELLQMVSEVLSVGR